MQRLLQLPLFVFFNLKVRLATKQTNKQKVTEVSGYRCRRSCTRSSNVARESRDANSWRPLRLRPSSLSRNGEREREARDPPGTHNAAGKRPRSLAGFMEEDGRADPPYTCPDSPPLGRLGAYLPLLPTFAYLAPLSSSSSSAGVCEGCSLTHSLTAARFQRRLSLSPRGMTTVP